jgi:DNA-binding NarL/FixJ family response regulator
MLSLMEQIRLIIIDQHKGVRNALRVRLHSTPNIAIVGTVDADGAKKLAQTDLRPDVALLGLTGHNDELSYVLDLVKLLVTGGTAVLALTSYIDDLARELVLQAGASDYRLKNINTPELLAEIELLAKINRQEQADKL